jgi:hypothetical protein
MMVENGISFAYPAAHMDMKWMSNKIRVQYNSNSNIPVRISSGKNEERRGDFYEED